ncbi:VCBS repeat-containing protein [Flagellimonas flava]|uniref:VCBS repeat-containing protein n=2 Tax=Flagellimonas flava TaxID=570519 RepID=UPI003D65B891
MIHNLRNITSAWALCLLLLFGCKQESNEPANSKELQAEERLFTLLSPEQTNIHFENRLQENLNINVLMYEYLYNGGGVAVGDYNGDGNIDIYFSANLGDNQLYLNRGDMQFEDVTLASGTSGRKGPWKTGVSSVDINSDGKLDIYLCYSGALPDEKRRNQLFINKGNNENGIPIFEESAKQYGLDTPGFSNQAHFFDYDHDGDLDVLMLNHNPKSLPVLNETSTKNQLKIDDPHRGLRLFKQTNGFFQDVTPNSGISGSALSYGLGLCISDVNNDGWEDFYVSNDYTIPDYLYINNGNGTFTDQLKTSMGHTSHFSMGNNIADIDNDGWMDIYTLDMLPEDNRRQKLLLSPENYEKFDLNLRSGFHYQYMRNMLQRNNGNGTYSEIGQLAGVSNTDWSWAALLADFDNDGWKDLYVTNGYFRDYTNLDFINYMEDYVQSKGRLVREDVLEIIKQMPSTDLLNYMFINKGGLEFENKTQTLGLDQVSNSNGAAYADLDNDGDLDLIVNNINKPAFIYQNESDEKYNYLQVKLKGKPGNLRGLGAKVSLYSQNGIQIQEQMTTRGYLSSVSDVMHFGLGDLTSVDSLKIIWSSGKVQTLTQVSSNQVLELEETNAVPSVDKIAQSSGQLFKEVSSPIDYAHQQVQINDFKRQSLLLEEFSHNGPCLSKGDVNNDGREDIFIGGAQNQSGALFVQDANSGFQRLNIPDFNVDKEFHDSAASFLDVNADGNLDLYVASGGYHHLNAGDELLQDRLYLGDGKGNFSRRVDALPVMQVSTGCIASHDVNGDGYPDLFVGGRVVPGRYPETPESFILMNDGKGSFKDETAQLAPEVSELGMVTDAAWADLNANGKQELVVVGEWMPITVFSIEKGKLAESTSQFFGSSYQGWWNTVHIEDLDKDGKLDIVAGNMGTNTQFQASSTEPLELYYDDFDQNGAVDPIFCFYIQGKSYPYVTRDELLGQLTHLRPKFNSYSSYADADLFEIFDNEITSKVEKLSVNHMETMLFMGTANGTFKEMRLPGQAQFSPVNEIVSQDFNQDGHIDLLLLGNNHRYKLRLGKFDANYGTLCLGDGNENFSYTEQTTSGLRIDGVVESAVILDDLLLVGIQGQSLEAYQFGAN